MNGKLFAVIAATGQGKTSKIKSLTRTGGLYVFDVQNEYRELEEDFKRPFPSRVRHIEANISDFLDNCLKIKNSNIICEEATGFFSGNIGKKAKRVFLSKRHNNNNYFLIFHSIGSVPKQIRQFIDVVILFKTIESEKEVESSFPLLLPYYNKVKTFSEIPKAKDRPTIQKHLIIKTL